MRAVVFGLSALVSLTAAFAQTAAPAGDLFPQPPVSTMQTTPDRAIDPFLAGAVGLMPFASGLYLSDRPARGVVFTLIDGLLALGMYSAAHTRLGDPDNVKYYVGLMCVNNVVDAWASARDAMGKQRLQARVTIPPSGGVEYAIRWKF